MILQGDSEKQKHLYYEFDRAQEPVGHGGMGVVYRGRMVDERTGAFRDVAIKEVQPEGDESERTLILDRARREASIQIRNDNIVEMLGFVEIEEKKLGTVKQRLYIVSEFLDGVTLDKVLEGVYTDYRGEEIHFAKDLASRYSANREETAIYIIKNVLSAIVALHDNGYLHRDIDPSNIMITADGKIKLIDFGIAKKQGSLSSNDRMQSEEGSFVGKVEYAAPELVSGKVSEQDFATDIYAIGVLFYKLLTGRLPFEGNRFEIIKGQLSGKPDLHRIKSAKYRAIVGKALSKQSSRRYSSASMMRADLDGQGPAPKWSGYVLSVLAILLVIVVVLILAKTKKADGKNGREVVRIDEYTTVTNEWENGMLVSSDTASTRPAATVDIKEYLAMPISSLWDTLKVNPYHSAALYAASLESEKQIPDASAKAFWNMPAVQNEIGKYISVNRPEISSKRLAYVLSCMAFVHFDEKQWTYPEFKSVLSERVKEIQREYPEIYVLPEGI